MPDEGRWKQNIQKNRSALLITQTGAQTVDPSLRGKCTVELWLRHTLPADIAGKEGMQWMVAHQWLALSQGTVATNTLGSGLGDDDGEKGDGETDGDGLAAEQRNAGYP